MRRIRSAVLLLLAAALSGVAVSQAKAYERLTFDIAQQPLSAALRVFAEQAHVQILRRDEDVSLQSVIAPPVAGEFSTEEALGRLLSGSGISYEFVNDRTVRLVGAGRGGSANSPLSERQHLSANSSESSANSEKNAASSVGTPSRTRDTELVATEGTSGQGGRDQTTSEKPLQEVLVTAQKREERLQNVPIAISVLSTAQLERPTVTSATDALNTIPGVAATKYYVSGGTQVVIRGVAAAKSYIAGSSPVAYYLDSMPFGLVKSAIGPDQNVYDLQRIEVLRGPQGTLYGASALNGVVRVLTHDADLNGFDVKMRASESYTDGGSNNYQGDLALNVPLIEGKLAARAVVGYENTSGWIDSPLERRVNDAQLRNYRLKLNAQPIDDLSIGLSWWSTRDHYGAPSTADDNANNSSVLNQPITTGFDAYAAKLGYVFSGYSLASTTSYLKYNNDNNLDYTALVKFPFAYQTALDSNVFSQEVLLNSPTEGTWRWSLGGIYRRGTDDRYQYNSIAGPQTALTQNVTSKSYAGYGQLTRVFLNGRLEATVGLRQFEDHVTQEGRVTPTAPLVQSEGRFHATTPRVALIWHANDNLMVYGSYSQGFRSGFPQDVGVPSSLPPVEADKLHNYEAGAKGGLWNGLMNFDLAVYYIDWLHVQQTLEVPFQNVYTSAEVNGDSASGEGIDLSVTTQPIAGLTLGVTASWNNLEMDSDVFSRGELLFHAGDRLNYSPELTAGVSAEYAFALGSSGLRARLSTAINHTSAQDFRSTFGGGVLVGSGDPITIGRVGISIDSRDRWTATLFVNNVNNERGAVIRPYFYRVDPDLTARIRPRTGGLQFEYRFK